MSAGTDTQSERGLSHEARNLQWLLSNFVEDVPGVRSVAVVSSDGLLLLTSEPEDEAATEDEGAAGGGGGRPPPRAGVPTAPHGPGVSRQDNH
ncbi:roadblock/LC7 domain-containing protein, partial [Actinacidiphila glaucinigra]